jgi:hypothetical protein
MWLQHLFSLLGVSVHVFFDAIGTTILGRIVDLIFAAAVVVVALLRTNKEHGWRVMLNHWREEYKGPMKFTLWAALCLYGPIAIWSVGRAIYTDHAYFVGIASGQAKTIKADGVTLQQAKDDCAKRTSNLREQVAGLVGKNETLASQNRDQQGSINNCQTQAIHLLTPIGQKFTILRLSGDDLPTPNAEQKTAEFLMLTNRGITPVRVRLECDQPFGISTPLLLGVSGQAFGGSGNTSPTAAIISIAYPAWTPETPIRVYATYVSKNPLYCKVEP